MDNILFDELKDYCDSGSFRKELETVKKNIAYLNRANLFIPTTIEVIGQSRLFLIPVYNENRKIGFIDRRGQMVIEPEFDEIRGAFYSQQSIVAVRLANKWNVIDSTGNKKLVKAYSLVFPSKDSQLATCCDYSGWSVIDVSNMSYVVESGNYDLIEVFRFGYARVKKDKLWGIINSKGELVVPTEYNDIYRWDDWYEATTMVRKTADDTYSKINLKGL